MRRRERLVIVGNGMVGQRFVEDCVGAAPDSFEITIVGAEPVAAYNRVLLSPLLAGEIDADETVLRLPQWFASHGIEQRLGRRAIEIDGRNRRVVLDDGDTLAYDACVLATGSAPIRLPLPGADLEGVSTFRERTDVEAFRAFAETGAPAVVVGGGLLGIETAYGLARAGARVTLVHLMDRLMERQVDADGGRLIQSALDAKGIDVVLEARTEEILGDDRGRVYGLRLACGRVLDAGLVVMAVGVQPNRDLAERSGIAVSRGVLVDDRLATDTPGVFAIGECAEHAGSCYGLVEPGYEQARILAERLAGGDATYSGSVLATNLKVSGVPVFSAGRFEGDQQEVIAMRDEGLGAYRKICVEKGRVAGVVLVGDTTDALWYRDLIASGARVDGIRDSLAFGRAFAEAA